MQRRADVPLAVPAAAPPPPDRGAGDRPRPPRRWRRLLLWGGTIVVVAALLAVAASYAVREPLRRYMEATLNGHLHGYTVRLAACDFHPLGFSLALQGLTISQVAHPQPPVAQIPLLRASVHWRALLSARLVADFLFVHPSVHVNRPQLQHEVAGKLHLREEGWQAALESIYPLKINRFRIRDGDLTYIDSDPQRPLHVSRLDLVADNVRNIRSPDRIYPSAVRMDGVVFDTGTLRLDGHANFLEEPHAGIDADLALGHIDIASFKPILARVNVQITGGTLDAEGHVEYAPGIENVHLRTLGIHGTQIDYVHTAQTTAAEEARAATVARAARRLRRAPIAVVRIDHVSVTDSTVAYVDQALVPGYRIFLTHSDFTVDGLTNRSGSGPASVTLTGQFMGSGDGLVQATFEPVAKTAGQFDVAVMIEGTELTAMNDLLRAFGGFDVVRGRFSLYCELSVRHGAVVGYVKPLFTDMQVYSRNQDAAKAPSQQLYELLVGVVQTVLQNGSGTVGTKVNISGTLSNPQMSTWAIMSGLLENAFIKALRPGLEHAP